MSFSVTGRPQLPAAMRAPRMTRRMRRPTHNAFLHFLPWTLTPFMIAPVLPGETLKNALFQARVLTTPVTNQLCGWWIETYWFYVKHRHLMNNQLLPSTLRDYVAPMLDQSATFATEGSTLTHLHSQSGDLSITRDVYNVICNHFFLDESSYRAVANTGLQKVRLRLPGWWDSIIPTDNLTTGYGGIGDDTIGTAALDQVGEIGKALEQWQTLVMLGVTDLSYDDWLRSFGVSVAAPREDRPELIRYTREWQYPSSAVSVDATAQRVSTVLNWALTERIDKDRRFSEPGAIMACVVARPKAYHSLRTSGIGQLSSAMGWQTPMNSGGLYEQYLPVNGLTGYSFDSRDLYLHGDQWVYAVRGTTNVPAIAMPADGAMDFASDAEINALFTDGASGYVKMDATVSLGIASGSLGPDVTPRTV